MSKGPKGQKRTGSGSGADRAALWRNDATPSHKDLTPYAVAPAGPGEAYCPYWQSGKLRGPRVSHA